MRTNERDHERERKYLRQTPCRHRDTHTTRRAVTAWLARLAVAYSISVLYMKLKGVRRWSAVGVLCHPLFVSFVRYAIPAELFTSHFCVTPASTLAFTKKRPSVHKKGHLFTTLFTKCGRSHFLSHQARPLACLELSHSGQSVHARPVEALTPGLIAEAAQSIGILEPVPKKRVVPLRPGCCSSRRSRAPSEGQERDLVPGIRDPQ